MIQILVSSLWQGAFVVAIAAGLIALVPQRHAATRYTVWFAALLALVLLPLSGMMSFGDSSMIPSGVIRTTTVASHLALQAANATGLWIAALWFLGSGVCIARLALSYVRIAAIMRSAVPAPDLGDGVFTSASIAVPVAAGFIHPMVIVPEEMATSLDRADLAGIVAHERAHLRRSDVLGNLFGRVVEALLFFNPWVYVIGRQLVREREAACDDWAVLSSIDPDRYASCLANLARRKSPQTSSLLTPGAIGSRHLLVVRISRLLNGKAGQVKTNYLVVTTAVVLFATLGFAFNTSNGLASGGSAVAATNSRCTSDAMVLKPVPPQIPDAYAKTHPTGQASVMVTVAADGSVSNATIVSASEPVFGKAALEAATLSTYKAAVRNCTPVSGGKYLFHVVVGP
jgi:beta-lactamase regulating signal transducer with metallopeptidase domain